MIKVGILDDDTEFRTTLSWHIDQEDEMEVRCQFSSGNQFLSNIHLAGDCDIMLMDIGLPDISGIECLKKLKTQFPKVNVIMQTVYTDDETVFDSLKAGALGYILKKERIEDILQAIQDVSNGGAPMSGSIARKVLNYFRKKPVQTNIETLSPREIEVLNLLIDGHSYKSIASELNFTTHTVRYHIHNIYQKLHVSTRAEAVAKFTNKSF